MECALRHIARRRRTLEAWGVAPKRITELEWWQSHTQPNADLTITAVATFLRPQPERPQRDAVGIARHPLTQTRRVLQRRYRPHQRIRHISERLGPVDLVMLEVGAFLPVHWGIFALAMHAWDDPAATLLALAQQCDVQLVMPRLGEPVEPARTESVTPWWRAADTPQRKKMTPAEVPVESKKMELPQTMPRPID